jgi:hypothetical protein
VPTEKNPAALYSLIKLAVTLGSPKTKDGGRGPDCFAAIRSLTSASTSPISSSSDLISPSSRVPDPLAAGEVWFSRGGEQPHDLEFPARPEGQLQPIL